MSLIDKKIEELFKGKPDEFEGIFIGSVELKQALLDIQKETAREMVPGEHVCYLDKLRGWAIRRVNILGRYKQITGEDY